MWVSSSLRRLPGDSKHRERVHGGDSPDSEYFSGAMGDIISIPSRASRVRASLETKANILIRIIRRGEIRSACGSLQTFRAVLAEDFWLIRRPVGSLHTDGTSLGRLPFEGEDGFSRELNTSSAVCSKGCDGSVRAAPQSFE